MQHVSAGSLKSPSSEDLARLSTLSVVSNYLNTSFQMDDLLKSVLGVITKAFQADRGFIRLFTKSGEVSHECYLDVTVESQWEVFNFTHTLFDSCVLNRAPVLVIDADQVAPTQSVTMTGIRSVMLCPLLVKERLLGVIYLDSLLKASCFEDNDLKLFTVLAEMVSVAVDRNLHAVRVEQQSEALDAAHEKLELAAEETIRRLSRAAEFRDGETSEHLTRVSQYCEAIALKLGLENHMVRAIKVASLLHDVGKLGIPDSIMLKPGRFTDYERSVMQQHTYYGEKILANSGNAVIELAAQIALRHHEKWDGSGYPEGLVGEDIPLAARIVAVADVFDAVSSARRYKESYSLADSFSLLEREAGSHFDPKLIETFLELRPQIEQIWNENQGPEDSAPKEDKKTDPAEGAKTEIKSTVMTFELALSELRKSPMLLAKESALGEDFKASLFTAIEFLSDALEEKAKTCLVGLTELLGRADLSFQHATKLSSLVQELEQFESLTVASVDNSPLIFILDSDPYQREVISTEATRRGMRVHECSVGSTLLEKARQEAPDLVILEISDEGAESVLETLRQEYPQLPLLILTRDGDLARRLTVASLEDCSYLHKPLPPAAILDEVEERLPGNDEDLSTTVLAFDDDRVVLTVVDRVLTRFGYKVFTVSDPVEFWDLLTEHTPDLLLLDLEMPRINGFEVCRVLRNDVEYRHLPIVVLTAHQEISEYQKALEAGADDVLSKPLQAQRLLTRIESRLARNRALQVSASRDPLTGFVHRRLAVRTAEQMFAAAIHQKLPFSVCTIEIDQFESMVEQNGWQASASVLRQVAELVSRNSRSEDVITRSKDYSLLLVLQGLDKAAAEQRLKSLNTKLSQHQGALGTVKCSGRFASAPEDGKELKNLLEQVGFSYNASY